jgi:hypothetical protein
MGQEFCASRAAPSVERASLRRPLGRLVFYSAELCCDRTGGFGCCHSLRMVVEKTREFRPSTILIEYKASGIQLVQELSCEADVVARAPGLAPSVLHEREVSPDGDGDAQYGT